MSATATLKGHASERTAIQPLTDDGSGFLGKLGERVRAARARRSMTRKDLARQSQVSERYLALLEAGQGSHWHKVDATQLWLFHAGSPLRLLTAPDDAGPVAEVRLGADVLAGEQPQCRIAPHRWQAAEADRGWALVSCIVSPGFEFEGFTLAPPGWAPGKV